MKAPKDAFMNSSGGLFEVKMSFHTKAYRKRKEKRSTSVIRIISLIRYHSMDTLDKGVHIIEVALY